MRRCVITGVVALALGTLICAAPAHAAMSRSDAEQVFAQAESNFDEGVRLLDSDRSQAADQFDAAIAGYEHILTEGGYHSGALHYNIGNAYMLQGDIGRAILAYRRALQLMPSDENLAANLAYARQRVRDRIEVTDSTRAERLLLFWHYDLSQQMRFAIFLAAFALGWCCVFLRQLRIVRSWWPMWSAGGLAVLCGLMIGSLSVEEQVHSHTTDGVIVASSAVGRKGPDESAYQPSFTEPLHAGVEVRVVERRVGWMLVELADGRQTWIREGTVALV